VTNEQDWEVDEPALSKKFDDDNFYTYYAFREMENGEAYVHSSVVAEMQKRIDELSPVHTCHDKCRYKGCVQRRRIEKLEAALRDIADYGATLDAVVAFSMKQIARDALKGDE
jgi:hypothetical protein